MKIIEPSVEILKQENPVQHVTRCARICYASESKGEEADKKLYDSLKSSGHLSVFRHETHYFKVRPKHAALVYWVRCHYGDCPYVEITFLNNPENNHLCYRDMVISTNKQFLMENPKFVSKLAEYEVSEDQIPIECRRYTILLNTSIAVSREGNRRSPNTITEMSTRYIKFGGKVEPAICRPSWLSLAAMGLYNSGGFYELKGQIDDNVWNYIRSCDDSFDRYNLLVDGGMKPEEARGVLPLDTFTKVIYTMSYKEWQHFFDLRLFGKTGRPHPNIKYLAVKIWQEFKDAGVDFPVPEGFDMASILI